MLQLEYNPPATSQFQTRYAEKRGDFSLTSATTPKPNHKCIFILKNVRTPFIYSPRRARSDQCLLFANLVGGDSPRRSPIALQRQAATHKSAYNRVPTEHVGTYHLITVVVHGN